MSNEPIETLHLIDIEAEPDAEGNVKLTIYYADDEPQRLEVLAGRSVAKVRTMRMTAELARHWSEMILTRTDEAQTQQ